MVKMFTTFALETNHYRQQGPSVSNYEPDFNRTFHGFGKAKFAYGGLVLSSRQFYTTAPAASKNDTQF